MLIFSSYKTISDILKELSETKSVSLLIRDADFYYAHTPKQIMQQPETLAEHLDLVLKYLEKIVNTNGLDAVIDNLIDDYFKDKKIGSDELKNFVKEIFVYAIAYHDHGKINENFQASPEKMNNPYFKGKENIHNQLETRHSALSSFIFLVHFIDEAIDMFQQKEQECAITMVLLFSYGIYKHHSPYLDDDFWQKIINENKIVESLNPYLKAFKKEIKEPNISKILYNLEKALEKGFAKEFEKSFPLYQLLRLNYSLLTASDFLATNEYMSGISIDDFGVFSRQRIQQLCDRVEKEEFLNEYQQKINFNKKTLEQIDEINLDEKPQNQSGENLNILRQFMATEAIRNIRANLDKSLFYLEAPTGGGKTNMSMLLTLELLKSHPELNKVFYVFPFTTLIDQTYQSIKESLDLDKSEIVALHSKASLKSEKQDDDYGSEKKNYIEKLFINYPFCLLSHISFFDILKTNRKEVNYLLHRLANSVVVIDELQAYPPKHWDKMIYFIQKYSVAYNIKFILMSATLPKIGNLKIDGLEENQIAYLLPNATEDYFRNINFSSRITFDFSLLGKKMDLDDLASKVLYESRQYASLDFGNVKPKDSVFTIIEFIFKRTATVFKTIIERINDDFFDEIFVLSGTILHHRRKYIINYLKNKTNRNKKILLITTQVVEAGVDIDMDIGFKDTSLLDSDEQLAGRINRNVKKSEGKLFLFHYNSENLIYGNDLRNKITEKLSIEEKREILQYKKFDELYQKIIDTKNDRNLDKKNGIEKVSDYIQFVNDLKFRSINDNLRLIEQENFSCYIPLDVPIEIDSEIANEKENIFSKDELIFLENNNVFPTANGKISGKEVFDVYIGIIQTRQDFIVKKIALKQLQSILSKFVFSIFANDKVKTKLTTFMDLEKSEYGYFYMERWQDFYDELSGIDELAFEDIEKVQFI